MTIQKSECRNFPEARVAVCLTIYEVREKFVEEPVLGVLGEFLN